MEAYGPVSYGFYAIGHPKLGDFAARNGESGGTAVERPSRPLFGCPLSKRNPDRYKHVEGECTRPPGFSEFRRVMQV
jgi:hypothetical protein